MGKASKRAPPAREPSSSDSESSYEFRVLKKNTAVAGAKPKKSAKPAPPPESSGEDDEPALPGDVEEGDVAKSSDSDDNDDEDEDLEGEEGSEEEDSESEDDDAKPAPAKAKAVVKPAVKPVLPTASKTKAAEDGPLGVFVDGIPYAATEADLRKHFEACGTITSVRMPRYQDTGRAMGYAHIDFSLPSEAAAAVTLDGKYLQDRFLNVAFAKPKKLQKDVVGVVGPRPKDCTTLYVTNLPYDTDEDAVTDAFLEFGEVLSVRLARWNHTQKLKGFGYVQFKTGAAAEAAVSSGDVKVSGRSVLLDYDEGKPKQSFKTAEGRSWDRTHKDESGGGGGGRGRGGRGGMRGRGGRGRGAPFRGGRGRGRD